MRFACYIACFVFLPLLLACSLSNDRSPVGPYIPFDERYDEFVLPEVKGTTPIVRTYRLGPQGEEPPILYIDLSLGSRHYRINVDSNRLMVAEGQHILVKDEQFAPHSIDVAPSDMRAGRPEGTITGWLDVSNKRSINK